MRYKKTLNRPKCAINGYFDQYKTPLKRGIDTVDFILLTLWTRLPSVEEFAIQNGINDYAQILYNKHRLVPQIINDVFERNLAFIKKISN